MKRIKYYFNNPTNKGTEDAPMWEDNLILKNIPYSEANEEIAKCEAYNGKYDIVMVEYPKESPSQLDIIEAQVTYTAMMTDTLLEEV